MPCRGAIVPWTARDLPDLSGTTVIVTGANSGLGEATTIALACRGAHVVMATRDHAKTDAMVHRILERRPDVSLEHLPLDLADLSSVRTAAETFLDRHPSVDRIVANAGVMATPPRYTADGFELQIGVNHLGHFAFVGHLLPALLAVEGGRVVTVSSFLHRIGSLDPATLGQPPDPYDRWLVYGRSKLANLLYVAELQRRLEAAGATAVSVAAHPGYTRTGLQTSGPTMQGGVSARLTELTLRAGNALFSQSAGQGVLPLLYAIAAVDVPGGSYWGPDGPLEQWGYPAPATPSKAAEDPVLARRLWDTSQQLTGVSYDLLTKDPRS
jgi:NAD(P)-dependent dehydrogenase (short-subunit alcohol dehydrogenase family)